jgi:hypothetical protein
MSKNFVDFVLDAQWKDDLAVGFAAAHDGPSLKRFFDSKNYTAITDEECERLAKAKVNKPHLLGAAINEPAPRY